MTINITTPPYDRNRALLALYPDHQWQLWRFSQVPKGYWENHHHQKQFFDWLGQQCGIKDLSDWYNLNITDIATKGGSKLAAYHYEHQRDGVDQGNMLINSLAQVYPDFPWQFWRFKYVAKSLWEEPKTHKQYFEWLGDELGLKSTDDWYKVKVSDVRTRGGRVMLNTHYDGSLSKALQAVFAEQNWQPWKFDRVPKGLWDNTNTVHTYFEWLCERLSINNPSDWSRVTVGHMKMNKGMMLITRAGGLQKMLAKYLPHHHHHQMKDEMSWTLKAQRSLFSIFQGLFPDKDILLNYQHPTLSFTSSKPVELDIFIPELSIAIEYQGPQHYTTLPKCFGSHSALLERDNDKRMVCASSGITLIEVPYTWDLTRDSVLKLVRHHRPEVTAHKPNTK